MNGWAVIRFVAHVKILEFPKNSTSNIFQFFYVNFQFLRASSVVSKKDQHLKLYFALKSNFLRFSLKLKGCELQQLASKTLAILNLFQFYPFSSLIITSYTLNLSISLYTQNRNFHHIPNIADEQLTTIFAQILLSTVYKQSFCLKDCFIVGDGFFCLSIYFFAFAPLLEMLLVWKN